MSDGARRHRGWRAYLAAAVLVIAGVGIWAVTRSPTSTAEGVRARLDVTREALLSEMARVLQLQREQLDRVRAIVFDSEVLGQGNPRLSLHPMTREECQRRRAEAEALKPGSPLCNAPNMVLAFDPGRGQTEGVATLCIDQFEFPNIPCEYPVVHVTANEAAGLCQAVGKRLCDAHEWEGACAGAVRAPPVEYAFGAPRWLATRIHNASRELVWAYGPTPVSARCATGSAKTPGCGGGFSRCGSNTYPAGAFPECVSPFGVYDQHGNVAEHMNLPTTPDELGGLGGLGLTEMKGSWFIWQTYPAHEDDCRWRASDWHPSRVRDSKSHRNYHLGFRCCLDVTAATTETGASYSSADETSAQHRKPVE